MFRVIYIWHGERHEHSLRFDRMDYATNFAIALQRAGWRAWVEAVRS